MNEEMLEKFRNNEIVINVETQQEWDEFMEWLENNTNMRWSSGLPTGCNWWEQYKEKSHISHNFEDCGTLSFGSGLLGNRTLVKYKELFGYNPFDIVEIHQNRKPGVTTVLFKDGDVVSAKRKQEAIPCLYTAVSAVVAKKIYGSNSAFKRQLKNKVKQNPRYKMGQRFMQGEVLEVIETNKGFYYVLDKYGDIVMHHESELKVVLPF